LKGAYDLLQATCPRKRKEKCKLIVETIGYNQTSYNVMKMKLGTLWMLVFHVLAQCHPEIPQTAQTISF